MSSDPVAMSLATENEALQNELRIALEMLRTVRAENFSMAEQINALTARLESERLAFFEKDSDQRKAIENREARLKAAEANLAELQERSDEYVVASQRADDYLKGQVGELRHKLAEAKGDIKFCSEQRQAHIETINDLRSKLDRLRSLVAGLPHTGDPVLVARWLVDDLKDATK